MVGTVTRSRATMETVSAASSSTDSALPAFGPASSPMSGTGSVMSHRLSGMRSGLASRTPDTGAGSRTGASGEGSCAGSGVVIGAKAVVGMVNGAKASSSRAGMDNAAGVRTGSGSASVSCVGFGSRGAPSSPSRASGSRMVLILSSLSPAMMTIRCVAYSSATGGMLMIAGDTQAGSSHPFASSACRALPATEKKLKTTSPNHGYAAPRICPFLNPHVAHVHSRIVPSTHTGPPQLRYGLMPQATNTRRRASKLRTNAMSPMTTPAATPGHILTPALSSMLLSSVFFPVIIYSFLSRSPGDGPSLRTGPLRRPC